MVTFDFSDIRGQLPARQALEISAHDRQPVILWGPPGSGGTMLARRFPTILPPTDDGTVRPFRAPHHTVSLLGAIGEIERAHDGVLYLDEATEFSPLVLYHVLCAQAVMRKFWLILHATGCPCGYWSKNAHNEKCFCDAGSRKQHQHRIPFSDDLRHVWLDDYDYSAQGNESSYSIRQRLYGGAP